MIIMACGSIGRPAQHRVQPTRAPRSKNGPVWLAMVRVGDRVFPDPRGRLTPTLGGNPSAADHTEQVNDYAED
jgi:hypothetical protein